MRYLSNKNFFSSLASAPSFLIALNGQSNADGQVGSGAIQSDLWAGVPNAKIFNGTSFNSLTVATSKGSFPNSEQKFGIEIRLMKLMCDFYGTTQYIAKYAVGGTSLNPTFNQWYPPNGSIYAPAISYTKAAIQSSGKVLKCIVWIQGEADATSIPVGNYQAWLTTMIASFRLEYGQPNLPFIIVSLSNQQNSTNYPGCPFNYPGIPDIVTYQQVTASAVPNCYFLLQNEPTFDCAHYNATGLDNIAVQVFNLIKTLP